MGEQSTSMGEQSTNGRNPFKAFWHLVHSRSMAEQIIAGILVTAILPLVVFVWNQLGDDAKFLNPDDGTTINLCPRIDGVAPAPPDGSNYYLVIRYLEIDSPHYRLAARVITSEGKGWKMAAPINIGAASDNENGWWELSLVLADKYQSGEYKGLFARAENGDEDAKDLGGNLPPNIVKDQIKVNRTSSTCS